VVGSFLNVCIWRLPRNESIVWPGSHCPRCKAKIRWIDNVPVVSYLVLGGRCRDCRERIPWRYPAVELLGGAAAVAAVAVYGTTPYAVAAAVLFWSFIAVTFIDFEHQIIPDEITLPGIVGGVVFSAVWPAWHGTASHLEGLWGALLGLAAGGGILWGLGTVGEWVFKKEAMGGGDVKLMAAVGAFLGWSDALLAVFLASFFGAFLGIGLRVFKGSERLPFGPCLVLGSVAALLWGEKIVSWYWGAVLQY
jgi:leader peptidase (prepilin peptidase)/N-methyltransferase